MGLAMIFRLDAMPYDVAERSMSAFGETWYRRSCRFLDCNAAAKLRA
jgi:hypothetical protein